MLVISGPEVETTLGCKPGETFPTLYSCKRKTQPDFKQKEKNDKNPKFGEWKNHSPNFPHAQL
jgi:hypothetical protein